MRSQRRKRLLAGMAVAICVGGVVCLAFCLNLLWGVQLRGSDFLFKGGSLGQSGEPVEEIVVVGIDDKSLEELGQLPWPRTYHADLIHVLAEAGARVIVFDMLFAEPAPGDEELAASLSDAGNVILPLVYTTGGHQSTGISESVEAGDFLRPLSVFEETAAALGHANVLPDDDGVVRKLPIAICSGDDCEPALGLAAVAEYLRRPEVFESPIENNRLPLAGRSIPLDSLNGMIINYVAGSADSGAPAGFQTVSYVDTARGDVDLRIFKDSIVVVGATASGIGDTFWTPTGRMMNGVDIHANTIHTILAGDFLQPAPSGLTIAWILTLTAACGLLALRLRVLWATLSAVSICCVYFLIAFGCFDRGMILNMVYPPLAVVGSFVGTNLYNVASERSEKREITRTFGRYTSPPVVDRILAALEKNELKLGGEQCQATVAFADIRGFTGMSEDLQAEELVGVLNSYLSIVIGAVLKYDGMVNKFGGDSVMAVWNVPTRCEDHAVRAIMAAIEAQRGIAALQQSDASLPKMDFGIGINTGEAVAGNLGSEKRSEYSVIGDCVNIAARLTDLAGGGKVWIGSDTFELVKDYVVATPLEPLLVKGKRDAVVAYEVVNMRQEESH